MDVARCSDPGQDPACFTTETWEGAKCQPAERGPVTQILLGPPSASVLPKPPEEQQQGEKKWISAGELSQEGNVPEPKAPLCSLLTEQLL